MKKELRRLKIVVDRDNMLAVMKIFISTDNERRNFIGILQFIMILKSRSTNFY